MFCAEGMAVISRILKRFRNDSLRDEVEESLRQGTGLRKGEWVVLSPFADDALASTAEEVVSWCREEMAETRRPYGIDQLALAIACAEPGGEPIASTSFGVFRPVEFYQDGGVAERVEQFFEDLDATKLSSGTSAVRFAAVLFSWGDVARATIFKDALD